MSSTHTRICCLALAGLFFGVRVGTQSQPAQSQNAPPQKKSKHGKPPEPKVEIYYGGVFLVGEGGIPNGPCFRINGRITSAGFFNELKSYDSDDGTVVRLGTDGVTQFPDKVVLTLSLNDQPCSLSLQAVVTAVY